MQISVIIPTFNDEATISKTLDALLRLVNVDEIIVVDGNSTDRTVEIVQNHKQLKTICLVKFPETNRGKQFDEGTRYAVGDVYWFLPADTRPVQGCGRQIKQYMRYEEVVGGNFEVNFEGDNRLAKTFNRLYPNIRSLNLVGGDSAMFVRAEIYKTIGGFKPLPIFEDVDLQRRLKKKGRFVNIPLTVTVSSNRFKDRSFFKTALGWSVMQTLYWLGTPPRLLAKAYKKLGGG
ncbi:MAG: glycosyltransferase [Acidobacteriota bacterium]|nr:glycosyltransferase [Acidobacteriota bacterium]